MAVFDPGQNAVVIRIVYDGPPHAGKTTSVRALARSLSRNVETPLEAAGRTMFFDWMEYTGGLFEGHQIRCQIVTVPGQPDLAARRRALLESADVVVFVADTADRESVARSVGHVQQMAEILARSNQGPPIAVVLQANKRDVPGAMPRAELAVAFGADYARTAVTESVAETGAGIRETFVLAVRLALDRIRELMARGLLPEGTPSVNSAEQLLARLEALPVPAAPRMTDEPGAAPAEATYALVAGAIEAAVDAALDAVEAANHGAADDELALPIAHAAPEPESSPAIEIEVVREAVDGDAPELAGGSAPVAKVELDSLDDSWGEDAEVAAPKRADTVVDEVAEVAAPKRADTEPDDDPDKLPPPPPRRAVGTAPPPRPRSPDARVPSGAIWPPVEGRIVLHEAVATGLVVHRVGTADWIAGIGTGWRIHSSASASFTEFDDGRQALLHWARLHASYAELLSPSRCVVLADAGGDTWRLWQIVKLMPSLRAWLVDSSDVDTRELFRRLTTSAIVLGEAWARCAETRLLPSLDSIGRGPNGPQFVALMPVVGPGPIARPTDVADRVMRELSRLLAAELNERRDDLAELLDGNDRPTTPWEELVAHAVVARA